MKVLIVRPYATPSWTQNRPTLGVWMVENALFSSLGVVRPSVDIILVNIVRYRPNFIIFT